MPTRSPNVPVAPSTGKRLFASAAPHCTLTMEPRIAGIGGMAGRCARFVLFIRSGYRPARPWSSGDWTRIFPVNYVNYVDGAQAAPELAALGDGAAGSRLLDVAF